jgi:nucleoid DNA-binding protein
MHKTSLIQELSKDTNLDKKTITTLLTSLEQTIIKTLKKNEDVNMIGFGSFKVVKTKARTGHNPQTGKEIKIKASRRAKFKASQILKDSLR